MPEIESAEYYLDRIDDSLALTAEEMSEIRALLYQKDRKEGLRLRMDFLALTHTPERVAAILRDEYPDELAFSSPQ
jgi:hypothetical protein